MDNDINITSGRVVSAAMKVHSVLGPGLLESAYKTCLAHELRVRGSRVQCEVPVAIDYGTIRLRVGYRIDLLVDNRVIVELKTTRKLKPIHEAQLLSYLRLSGCKVGLLINFNVMRLRAGIKRMVNGL
jgi:GxxExxY protein